jgi:hypothetical protein
MKLINSLWAVTVLACSAAMADRTEVDLSGKGWRLWQDKAAVWQNDELFLPPVDLGKVPVNPPTGGWDMLNDTNGIAVSVPGTAEEYLSNGTGPGSVIWGVTWWWREIQVPEFKKPCRVILHIGAARLRSEGKTKGDRVH